MQIHVAFAYCAGLVRVNDVDGGRGYNARAGIADRCVWIQEVCVYLLFFLLYVPIVSYEQSANLRYIH